MVRSNDFNGEILHCNAVRLRVTGSGNLALILRSLDEVNTSTLAEITMAATTAVQPTQLANFSSQRICLELGTDAIDETFTISKIVIFVKPLYSELPR